MEQQSLSFPRQVYLLGALRVYHQETLSPLSGEKSQSLFAYLMLHPRVPHRREILAERLFPDTSFDRVRRNFSDTLYRLQKSLGNHWLIVEGETIALKVDENLWVDVWEFDRLAASPHPADQQKATELYAGDLLPECYDDWILPERELRRNQFLFALENFAAHQEALGNLQQALLTTRRLLRTEPLHEPAHQVYLRLLGRLQRYGEAQAHYEYLRGLLQTELAAEPLAETQLIIQGLERERSLAATPLVTQDRTPFVGRIAERAAALSAVEATLNRRGGILAIEGEGGIGKSRLVREIIAGARWRGITVLQGTASETPDASPFAPLIAALTPFLNGPRGIQLETILAAETLAALSPLHPVWNKYEKGGRESTDQPGRRFFNALRPFGVALAQLGPLVLTLDDLHWADPALWECLKILSRSLPRHGALLLLAYRRPEIEKTPGWELLQAWDREGQLQVITLPPLTVEEVAQLVGEKLPVIPAEIHALTGGSPFLISEWLAAPPAEPPMRHFTVTYRLPALSLAARLALEGASVLGEVIPYRLWASVVEITPLELAGISDELTAHHWLQPSATGFAFLHDLIRTAFYESIDPSHRQTLHARASSAYHRYDPENARAYAFHLDRAGLAEAAAFAYRRAGEQDLGRYAYREAQTALSRSLTLMPSTPTLARIETALGLAQTCEKTGDRTLQRPALEEALDGARLLNNNALRLRALLEIGRAANSTSAFTEAETSLNEALSLSRQMRDQLSETEAIYLLSLLAYETGNWHELEKHSTDALDLARTMGHKENEGRALRSIGLAAMHMGQSDAAVKWLEQSIHIHRSVGDRLGVTKSQTTILGAFYEMGAWDQLIATAEELIPVQEAFGDLATGAAARHNLALAYRAIGDLGLARQSLERVIQDFASVQSRRRMGLSRNVLGNVAEDEGHYEEALELYHLALEDAEAVQAPTEEAYARHDLGALLLHLNRPLESIPQLETALAIWKEQENVLMQTKSETFLGLAYLALGEKSQAEALAERGWEVFKQGLPLGGEGLGGLWALYELLKPFDQFVLAHEVILSAHDDLHRQAQALSNPVYRQTLFERVPVNQKIMAEYDRIARIDRAVSISLARQGAPLGRALQENERVTVHWTVNAPEDETIPDKTTRRHHRLKRLLQEAEDQGAVPTDEDLARALGVSRRTILRDMQTLAQESPTLGTRKRNR